MPLEDAVVVALAVVGLAVVAPPDDAVVAPPDELLPEHSPLEIRFLIQGRNPWTRA